MDLTPSRVAPEAALFYNMFSLWRKMTYAISLVYFENEFGLQCYGQMACCAVMTGYLLTYRPCARYVDNVSKVLNELTFGTMLATSAYVKAVETGAASFNPSSAGEASAISSAGTAMVVMTLANMGFHGVRLVHNTVQAAGTLKRRRR